MVERLSSLRLPGAEDVEVVLVRLADGRLVARTKQELEALEKGDSSAQGGKP